MARVLVLTHKPAKIEWSKLADTLEFKIMSRLRSLDLLDDLQFLQNTLTAGAQNPKVADLSQALLEYVIANRTDFDVEDFRTNQAQAQAVQAAQAATDPNVDGTSGIEGDPTDSGVGANREDISPILGQ